MCDMGPIPIRYVCLSICLSVITSVWVSVRVLSMLHVVKLLRLPYKMLKNGEFDVSKSSDSIQQQYTSSSHTHSRAFSNCSLSVQDVTSSAAFCRVSSLRVCKCSHSSTPLKTDTELVLLISVSVRNLLAMQGRTEPITSALVRQK